MFERIKAQLQQVKKDLENRSLQQQKIFIQDYTANIKRYSDNLEQVSFILDSYAMNVSNLLTEINDVEILLAHINNTEKKINEFVDSKEAFYKSINININAICK